MVIDMSCVPQVVSRFPYFLQDRLYQNPIDKDDSPFMHAYGTKLHYFDWLNQPGMEDRAQAFANHMSFKDMGKKWFQMTDVKAIFNNPTDAEAVLMVDIGGNQGHDLIGFHEAYPELPGRLILQDLQRFIPTPFQKPSKPRPTISSRLNPSKSQRSITYTWFFTTGQTQNVSRSSKILYPR